MNGQKDVQTNIMEHTMQEYRDNHPSFVEATMIGPRHVLKMSVPPKFPEFSEEEFDDTRPSLVVEQERTVGGKMEACKMILVEDMRRKTDCLHEVAVGTQCSLGREKLMSAPPYKHSSTSPHDDSASNRYPTAPCVREAKHFMENIPAHVIVTFKSALRPEQVCSIPFPRDTKIKHIKHKLAKLISVSYSNLLLTKNRTVIQDSTHLNQLKTDAMGNIVFDVFTKNSEEFSLSDIPKESYLSDFLQAEQPEKQIKKPFITIKFRVPKQNGMFTRCYHAKLKIHEVKKDLTGLFGVCHENIVLLHEKHPLKDQMCLLDLDIDKYGIVEMEVLMKEGEKLNLNKLFKENPVSDVISVTVPYGNMLKQINVEIISDLIKKPYLGGYKNKLTGQEYHHAYTQTSQKAEKLSPEKKICRDTQTAEEKMKISETGYSRATQMSNQHTYIPTVCDRIVVPRPYESYEHMVKRLNHDHYASIIQRAWRHYQFRKQVANWLAVCMARIARIKEEERLEEEESEKLQRNDLVTKTFPKTREDFEQLYSMVDHWKRSEIERISKLHAKGPKIAEMTLLLDKEVEMLRCIEAHRVRVKEDNRKLREKRFLEEISKPVAWYGRSGHVIQMETVETQKAAKLRDLYKKFLEEDMEVKERIELLVDMKFALHEFRHPLAEEIITLLDRECDLLVRRCNKKELEFLRRRISASIYQLIKTSELNSDVLKRKEVRDYRSMENSNLLICTVCKEVKHYKEFHINTMMTGLEVCQSCGWKDVNERMWVDMTPYKYILRTVQRCERRRKCWGSLAFVIQPKDVFYIVEKLWHGRSAISECTDIKELRLIRWHVKKDWSPWNSWLITVQESKAHLKLENPEEVYDEELVQKVKTIHKLAKATFEQLLTVDKRYTESGDWHHVRVEATDRVDATRPL